ncbi:hypothetical protein RvY_14063-2 [Ramazzottius varieornatus]|uniref:DNA-directed RNA polymerase N-terminal domain-containing protein n=1 Tax=Ramazzottius varieornatus TaxID=947166 RepID=A0A1D1VQ41_RAMVA|nr:hypothetical protein RvY_14063-2 [Ramazzottius varieornatus]
MGLSLRLWYHATGAWGSGRNLLTTIHLLGTSSSACRMTRMKATSKSASTPKPGPLESAASGKKKPNKKSSSAKPTLPKSSVPSGKNSNEFDDVHQEIIKILQGRRHQLKAKIKFLREQDALLQKTRPRGRSPASSGPPHMDRRLDVLAAHHVKENAPLDQDHLKNISDFRIQSEDTLRRSQKTPPTAPTPAKRRKEEIDRVEKCRLDATQRELTLMDLNSSLKSYIIACTQTDMIGPALSTTAFYREKFSQPSSDKKKILSVEVYNLIMNIFAKKGKICQVKEIFQLMMTENVKPDTRSFALALETVARVQPIDVKMAKSIAKQMQDRNIPLNDIFLQCSLTPDEKERILEAIHCFRPNFQPAIPYNEAAYLPPVMQSLNASNTCVLKETPYRGVISYDKLLAAFREQLQHEKKGVITIKSVEAVAATEAKVLLYRQKLEGMKKEWARCLRSAYDRNFELLKQQFRQQKGVSIYPYLCALNREECVEALMEEIIRLAQGSEGYSPTTLILYMQMGNKMMNRYLIKCKEKYQLIDKLEKTYTEYLKYFGDKQLVSKYNCRQYWQKIEHDMKFGVRTDLADHLWPRSVIVRVGKFLYDMIINEIKVDTTVLRPVSTKQFAPAVYKVYRHYGEKLKEEVKPHPVLAKLYRSSMQDTLTFEANMVPTVVPPHPWLSSKTGGYLVQNSQLSARQITA